MNSLFLLRHAKSSWDEPGLEDLERSLSKRGKKDAPFMGKLLFELQDIPDLIISSPAKRALSTARRIACEICYDEKKIIRSQRLYMASIEDFTAVISGVDEKIRKLMIVSHNFGITDYANFISNAGISSMPTCSIVKVFFSEDSKWKRISETKGTLAYFKYPKMFN